MNSSADKSQMAPNQSAASDVSRSNSYSKIDNQFIDNRPESAAQRKLYEIANNSYQISQFKKIQEITNNIQPHTALSVNEGFQDNTVPFFNKEESINSISDGVIQGVFQYSHTTGLNTDSGRTEEEITAFYKERGWELATVWSYDGVQVYTDARNTQDAMSSMVSGNATMPVMIDVSRNMNGSSTLLVGPEYFNELMKSGYFNERGAKRYQIYQQFMKEKGMQVKDSSGDNIPTISKEDYEVMEILDSGSTKPQHVKFKKTNVEKVIKFGKDEGHLMTEVLANKLYEKAGIPTLPIELVNIDGQLAQMTDFVKEFSKPDEAELVSSEDFMRHIGADMLFANWDLFKTDNWMKIKGRMVRSDNGGALDRSAQGHLKDSEDWNGRNVKDIDSMRKKSNSPYNRLTDHEVADSIRTLSKVLTKKKIDEAFEESHFPVLQREGMRDIILKRLQIALEWADKVYEIERLVLVDHSWDDKSELEPDLLDDSPIDLASELIRLGYKHVPDNAPQERLEEFLRNGRIQPPDPQPKTGNPHESIPLVGPEEMLREDQFGGGLAKQMPKFFDRMKTGRLVRRMSDGEKAAFEKAAASKDIMEIVSLIFPQTGKPGARGEMVWSVNKPYIFEREIAVIKGIDYTGSQPKHNPEDYKWVMEIFITDEMLDFLHDYAYINNPTGGSKSSAFMGNPTLKLEGQAGGRGGEDGIPNVVIKKDGFAKFWRGVQAFQFVKAEDHLWKHASNNEELLKAKEERQRKEEIEKAKAEKELQSMINQSKPEDNDPLGGMFSDEPQFTPVRKSAYDIIRDSFASQYSDQVGVGNGQSHSGLLHPHNTDAPISMEPKHIKLRAENIKDNLTKRVGQNQTLIKWLDDSELKVAHNNGSGLNCLIISLLMHASGNYGNQHSDLAAYYREKLVQRFPEIRVGEMLYSDNPAYKWLVGEINKDFRVSLDVQFIQSEENGRPYMIPAIQTGLNKVIILDYGGHYEAVYRK